MVSFSVEHTVGEGSKGMSDGDAETGVTILSAGDRFVVDDSDIIANMPDFESNPELRDYVVHQAI